MVVRKVNYKKIAICLIVLVSIIWGCIFFVNYLINDREMKNSYEYKFSQKGYLDSEISIFQEYLSDEEIDYLLDLNYNEGYSYFVGYDYFDFSNLKSYVSYYSENNTLSVEKVIAIINTYGGMDWYEEIYETDTSLGELMLVNKFYQLSEEYVPELVLVPASYAYDGKYVSEIIYDDLINLITAASSAGHTLVVSQGYRSYESQSTAYESYKSAYSSKEADNYVARAGHSEYQTGLSVDIEAYNKVYEDSSESLEYEWLIENCYKYGFVLRYTEETEDITGFYANDWRFRYVGVEAATIMYENSLTLEEYYAYYVIGEVNE